VTPHTPGRRRAASCLLLRHRGGSYPRSCTRRCWHGSAEAAAADPSHGARMCGSTAMPIRSPGRLSIIRRVSPSMMPSSATKPNGRRHAPAPPGGGTGGQRPRPRNEQSREPAAPSRRRLRPRIRMVTFTRMVSAPLPSLLSGTLSPPLNVFSAPRSGGRVRAGTAMSIPCPTSPRRRTAPGARRDAGTTAVRWWRGLSERDRALNRGRFLCSPALWRWVLPPFPLHLHQRPGREDYAQIALQLFLGRASEPGMPLCVLLPPQVGGDPAAARLPQPHRFPLCRWWNGALPVLWPHRPALRRRRGSSHRLRPAARSPRRRVFGAPVGAMGRSLLCSPWPSAPATAATPERRHLLPLATVLLLTGPRSRPGLLAGCCGDLLLEPLYGRSLRSLRGLPPGARTAAPRRATSRRSFCRWPPPWPRR
jgi:hypothetical protein